MAEEEPSGADPSRPGEPTDDATCGSDDAPADQADRGRGSRREVVVPLPLYKTVTVFSTLLAVVLVVGGMIALDQATGRSTFAAEEVSLPLATAGVLAIVLGAAVYAFSTRFRAEGMGNPKEDADEGSNDG